MEARHVTYSCSLNRNMAEWSSTSSDLCETQVTQDDSEAFDLSILFIMAGHLFLGMATKCLNSRHTACIYTLCDACMPVA